MRRQLQRPARGRTSTSWRSAAAIERWSAGAASPVATAPGAPQRLLLVAADRASPAVALLPALVTALGVGRAVAAGEGVEATPAGAVQAAVRAGMARAALVAASVEDEGPLRGTGRVAIACRATARLSMQPPCRLAPSPRSAGRAPGRRGSSPRSPPPGRADCLTQLAAELRVGVEAALAGGAGPSFRRPAGPDVDATLTEPAAVPALLKCVRALGTVSSAEIHRVAGGHAELRILDAVTARGVGGRPLARRRPDDHIERGSRGRRGRSPASAASSPPLRRGPRHDPDSDEGSSERARRSLRAASRSPERGAGAAAGARHLLRAHDRRQGDRAFASSATSPTPPSGLTTRWSARRSRGSPPATSAPDSTASRCATRATTRSSRRSSSPAAARSSSTPKLRELVE